MFPYVGDLWKYGTSIWNHISILHTTGTVITSGLAAAILDSVTVINVSSLNLHAIVSSVPENMVIAFEILILSHIQPET